MQAFSAPPRRQVACQRRVCWLRPRAQATANKIDRNGPSVVNLTGSWSKEFSVDPAQSTCTVGEYLVDAQQHLQTYKLPMGAQLRPKDATEGQWELQLPALEFLDVYIRPCAGCRMETSPERLDVISQDITIDSSEQVDKLNLANRYDVDVVMTVLAKSDTSFEASCTLKLFVDVPFPFNMTPKPVTEAGGNAVVNALLANLMPAFGKTMVQDIEGRYRQ